MAQDSKSYASDTPSSEKPTTIEPALSAESSVELSPSVAPDAETGGADESLRAHSVLDNPELLNEPPPQDERVGTTFAGRYKILSKLGEGGMGIVYVAEHIAIEKKVALKVLLQEYARKPDLKQRFLQEAKAAARIGHENIVDITDFGDTPDGSVFFAMEYLEGMELSDAIKKQGAFPWDRAKPILMQICRAMGAAHSNHIIHRDMKPENIFLIAREGKPDFIKVLDFGIAKVSDGSGDGERRLTKTGMIFGTPEYMSPEQAQGHKPDHRVDVYALGVIMYELMTGKVPFKADTFMGILTKHIFEQPTPPSEVEPSIPGDVEAVILKAMAKDRDERFKSMTEMAAAIQGCTGRHTPRQTGGAAVAAPRVVTPAPGALQPAPLTVKKSSTKKRTDETLVPPPSEMEFAPRDVPGGGRGKMIAIVVVIALLAGGGLAFVMLKKKPGAGTGSATSAAGPGSGSTATTPPGTAKGTGTAAGAGVATGSGTGSALAKGTAAGPGSGSGTTASRKPKPGTAAAVKRPSKVRLTVTSRPEGANIIVAGEVKGETPHFFSVKKGSRQITVVLRKRGYHDLRLRVRPDKSRKVSGKLRRKRLRVRIPAKVKTKTKVETKVRTRPTELLDPFSKSGKAR